MGNGIVVEVKEDVDCDDCYVTVCLCGQNTKILRESICKVLPRPLKEGDRVKTGTGLIGTVCGVRGNIVEIRSGSEKKGVTLEFHRKAICKVINSPGPVVQAAPPTSD